jgi:hypothetical protein
MSLSLRPSTPAAGFENRGSKKPVKRPPFATCSDLVPDDTKLSHAVLRFFFKPLQLDDGFKGGRELTRTAEILASFVGMMHQHRGHALNLQPQRELLYLVEAGRRVLILNLAQRREVIQDHKIKAPAIYLLLNKVHAPVIRDQRKLGIWLLLLAHQKP